MVDGHGHVVSELALQILEMINQLTSREHERAPGEGKGLGDRLLTSGTEEHLKIPRG